MQNIVNHSDSNCNHYADMKNALSAMTSIACHINDMKRKHEHAVRVQEIQSLLYGWEVSPLTFVDNNCWEILNYTSLLSLPLSLLSKGQDLVAFGDLQSEGSFRTYGAKTSRHLFLFDKMLLIAKKKDEGILSYKTHIMVSVTQNACF